MVINQKFFGNKQAKIQRVEETVRQMYQNNEPLTVRSIILKSGVAQRVVVSTLRTMKEYDPRKFKSHPSTT